MQEQDTDVFEPASGLGFRPATGGGYREDTFLGGFAAEPSPAPAHQRPPLAGRVFAAAAFVAVLLSAGTGYALSRSAPAEASRPAPAATAAPVGPLRPVSVTAGCVLPPGRDGGGNPVTFGPENLVDGEPATAWRCAGAGGQRVTVRFAAPVLLTAVGLVPGYAKTDPYDGTDRFAQNHTVTRVRWEFAGAAVVQDIAAPGRETAWQRLAAPVEAHTVTLTVLATGQPGADRDVTAVSELSFRGSARP